MQGGLNGGGGGSGAPYGGSHGGAATYYGGTMPFNPGMMNRPDQSSQYPPAGYGSLQNMPPQMQMYMNPMNMPRMMPPWPGRPMMMPTMANGDQGWNQGRESSYESSRSSNFSGSQSRSRSRDRSWSRGRSRSRSRERHDRRRGGNDKTKDSLREKGCVVLPH